MRFSVVIPTYNRQLTLHQCLTALQAQDYPDYEIIVVDDGSTDSTHKMIAAEFPQVRYIYQANRGPAAARNTGIRIANGEIIAFTDDDCIPPQHWLSCLADGYLRYPKAAAVGGYQEAVPKVLETRLLARYERYVNRYIYNVTDQEYLGGFECPAGGTNNISYRRQVLEEVSGFDETFPVAAGEDAYLKWQVVQRGYSLLFVPVKVAHLHDYTLSAFWRQQVRRGIGAAHFEWRLHGCYPRPPRILGRWLKRTFLFLPDLVRMGPGLAGVQMIGGWADAWGQYKACRLYRPQFESPEGGR